MNQCGRCGAMVASGYLCELCDSATIRALSVFSTLVRDLRHAMTDLRAVPSDNVRVDGTSDPRLGADMKLSERSHGLYAVVANWCVGWALALPHIAPPEHLANYGDADVVTGLPGGYLETLAPSRVASWLIANHDEISQLPDAGDYSAAITEEIANEARALGYRPSPRRVPEKLCRGCKSETLRMKWPIDGHPSLYCTACGGEWTCGPILSRAVLQAR